MADGKSTADRQHFADGVILGFGWPLLTTFVPITQTLEHKDPLHKTQVTTSVVESNKLIVLIQNASSQFCLSLFN